MSLTRPDATVTVRTFAPGYLDTPESDDVPFGALVEGRNCFLQKAGVTASGALRAVLGKRDGSRLLNATALASGEPVDVAEYLKEDGTIELVAVCDGDVYAWDGAAFNAVTGGTGFSGPVRFHLAKDNLVITDGAQMLRYNGTACLPVGEDAPATAPTLALGSATGVTGTYEGYWVGYDPVMDHETSPSPTSSAVAFTDDKRQWTQPAHTLAAQYTRWRVYCRRTDTNENNFFRAGEDAIGTTTITEATSDAARRDPGPREHDNDPPPAFAWLSSWKGYPIGAVPESADYYVGKQDDPESFHPRNVFRVNGNQAVRSGHPFQNRAFLLQTETRSFELRGDGPPFVLWDAHTSFGNVCPDAYVEGPNHFYAWDRDKGPYRSNLETWEPLADRRIKAFVGTVNRLYLGDIRAVHVKALSLILWAVPTNVDRRRTLLAYNYELECWLPPITGLEYYSLATFTDATGATGLYCGDYWGRVYELFSGTVDGPPSGDTEATITAATSGTVTCSGASFYTTGSGLAGMPAAVVGPAGAWQWVRVQSNTGTVLTLDTTDGPELGPVPSGSGWMVIVGGIEWYGWFGRWDFQTPDRRKRGGWVFLQGEASSTAHALDLRARFNGRSATGKSWSITFPSAGGVWGRSLWSVAVWGAGGGRRSRTKRLTRTFHTLQLGFRNYYPGQPFVITMIRAAGDLLGRRVVDRG
ncbi:MAG: hypothetical protein AB7G23_03075 [Vicinamibacterales bacterium]